MNERRRWTWRPKRGRGALTVALLVGGLVPGGAGVTTGLFGGAARAAEVADLRSAYAKGDYRRALAVGDTLLVQGLPGGRDVGVRAVMAAAWLEESRLAERLARFEAEVLTDAYTALVAEGGEAALDVVVPDRLLFYRGLAALLAGEADTARVVLGRIADDPDHPTADAARVWRAVADLGLSGASIVSGIPMSSLPSFEPSRRQQATLEAALASLALTGRVDDRLRERLTDLPKSAPGTREERLHRLLEWDAIGPDAGGEVLLGPDLLAVPVDRLGDVEDGGIALHDPWILLAYARLTLREARAVIPEGDAFGQAGRFLARTRAQLALLAGRPHDARSALSDATEPLDLALLALASSLAMGSPPVDVLRAAAADSTGRALAECVLFWDRDPTTDWGALAPPVQSQVDRWITAWEGTDGRIDDHWARWAAALVAIRAGVPDRARVYLDGVYDPGRHGNLERNPALRLPETLSFLMRDVNNQVLVLRAASGTAAHVSQAWGVYDALQAYFLVRFVDTPVGVRP